MIGERFIEDFIQLTPKKLGEKTWIKKYKILSKKA
jgi:hypothetical protein